MSCFVRSIAFLTTPLTQSEATIKKIISRVLRAFQPVKTDPAISGIHIRCLKPDYELVGVKQKKISAADWLYDL